MFFFFKQKTAYEMRISDWSSDVCSSGLFREGGTVTAANSSSISDGAAALLLTRGSQAEQLGLKPQAVIHGHAVFADAPNLFPSAPIGAQIGRASCRERVCQYV